MEAIDGGKKFRIRDLTAGDERVVGAMIASVTGDPRVQNAVASRDEALIMMSIAACLLERVPRQIALWCASLIGEEENFDIKEYRKEERKLAEKEGRRAAPDGEVRYEMEEDIVKKMDSYPSGTYLEIIAEVMEAPGFDGFLASSWHLSTATKSLSERFRTRFSKNSASQTEN